MDRINTLAELFSHSGKCVVVPLNKKFRSHTPVAFIIGMPARTVYYLFREGMYVYEPKDHK